VSDPTLELRGGDTVQIGGPSANLMKVVQRTRGGYIVLPNGAELTEMVTDRDLVAAYNAKTLRHWPCNLQNVEENRAKVLQTSFGSWPENYQREALRRLSFVEAVDLARDAHPMSSRHARRSFPASTRSASMLGTRRSATPRAMPRTGVGAGTRASLVRRFNTSGWGNRSRAASAPGTATGSPAAGIPWV